VSFSKCDERVALSRGHLTNVAADKHFSDAASPQRW
jgi:hypothetical protein